MSFLNRSRSGARPHRLLRGALLAAWVVAPILSVACGTKFVSCSEGGCGGENAAGGRSSSGGKSSGGERPGGSGGAFDSPGGQGGETSEPGVGGAVAVVPAVPEVQALLGGRTLMPEETLRGVHEAAVLLFQFSEAMDPESTQEAYAADQALWGPDAVTFSWNAAFTELTIIPSNLMPYPEVTTPEDPSDEYVVSLSTGATSLAGAALQEPLELQFSPLKRVHQQIMPDGENSLFSLDTTVSDETDVSGLRLPYVSAPFFYCNSGIDAISNAPVVAELGYRAGDPYGAWDVLIGTTANLGNRNVAIVSFALSGVPPQVERARLRLAKWQGYMARPATTPFVVEQLASGPVTAASGDVGALGGPLVEREGAANSTGHGFFEFDVTDAVSLGVLADDTWAVYRTRFEGMESWQGSGEEDSVCASLALDVTYLAE
jgi:hypothetical protein